jgi:tryptophan 2,3-dioxygenase
VIRRNLGNGSGQESPGYNAVQTAAPYVLTALEGVLDRAGLSLADVYRARNPALERVCESLLDFDGRYQTWLMGHFMLVRRTIGVGRDTKALDGVPARVLTGRMTKPLFGELWRVRDELTEGWAREGSHVPGAAR